MTPGHVLQSTVVLDELRLVYVPVPKAGSTSLLWALAALAGLSEGAFIGSYKLEMTRALAVHDLSVWGAHRILGHRSPEERQEILCDPDWVRFTVVREPVRRLWSSWVGKVLCRDPRFTRIYAHEDWFPPVPRSSTDVLTSFRQFVRAVAATPDEQRDPHWASQAPLIGLRAVSYAHIGRVERLPDTVAFLNDHLSPHGLVLPPVRRENPVPLPYDPGVLDATTAAVYARSTEVDDDAFGYRPPTPAEAPPPDWHAAVEASLPALGAIIERNERIRDLRDRARAESRLTEGMLAP